MALAGTDKFLINNGSGKNFTVKAQNLFNGNYDEYYALVNYDEFSFKCKVKNLEGLDEDDGHCILLVQRGTRSHKVTLTELLDKYATYATGEKEYIGTGYNTFTVPDGVRHISIICVGGGGGGGAAFFAGGGGGGGALSYNNTIRVKAGDTLEIYAGSGGLATRGYDQVNPSKPAGFGGDGQDSYVDVLNGPTLCFAGGGKGGEGSNRGEGQSPSAQRFPGGAGGTNAGYNPTGQVTFAGGSGGYGAGTENGDDYDSAGGGGAPGAYNQAGKSGMNSNGYPRSLAGGTSGGAAPGENGGNFSAQSAGGIGLKGKGNRGGSFGKGGSGGTDGNYNTGGNCGGGGGGQSDDFFNAYSGAGGDGGVRIIWPGTSRTYP